MDDRGAKLSTHIIMGIAWVKYNSSYNLKSTITVSDAFHVFKTSLLSCISCLHVTSKNEVTKVFQDNRFNLLHLNLPQPVAQHLHLPKMTCHQEETSKEG